MAILFAGGEDTSFTNAAGSSALFVSTSTSRFRSAYARCSVTTNTANGAAALDPPTHRLVVPSFTAGSVVWVHAQVYDQTGTPFVNQQTLILRSPDGVARVLLRHSTTYGTMKISTRNAAGVIVDLITASSGITAATLTQIDLKVDYSLGGGFLLYVAGVLVANYVGDPRTDSATTLSQVELAHFSQNGTYWSEVIISDTDTRGMALWTLPPIAAGNTQGWTPNTVGNINEVALNDATFIATTSVNILSEWTIAATGPPAGTWAVSGVIQEARVTIGTTGPQHFDWVVRAGGTDYLAADPKAPTTNFANYRHQWALNPNTGLDWTLADLAAVGLNLGITSQV